MNENNKRLVKNTVIIYIQTFVSLVVSLLTARLILNALGASDYGTFSVVGGFVSMMVIVCNPMMTGAMRFFAYDIGKNDQRRLANDFNTTNIIYWFLAIIVVVFLETIGLWFVNHKMVFEDGRMNAVWWVYQFSVFSFFFNILSIPYNALLIAHENIFISALFQIIERLLQIIVVILLCFTSFDKLIFYSAMLFVISVLMRIAPQIYCRLKYAETTFKLEFDKTYFKSIMSYAGYNSIGVMAIVGMNQGINVLLNLFCGPVINAAKGISASATGIVQSLTSNLDTPVRPQLTKYYAIDDMDRMWQIVEFSTKLLFYISMIIIIPLCLEINYILKLWLGNAFPFYTSLFIQLTLLAGLITNNGVFLSLVLQAANKIRSQQLAVAVTNLLVLPLSYFALKIGCKPFVPFVIQIVMNTLFLYINIKIVGHDMNKDMLFFYKTVLKLFIVFLLTSVICFCFHYMLMESLFRLLIIILVNTFFSSFLIYFLSLNLSEREWVLKEIKKSTKFIMK